MRIKAEVYDEVRKVIRERLEKVGFYSIWLPNLLAWRLVANLCCRVDTRDRDYACRAWPHGFVLQEGMSLSVRLSIFLSSVIQRG